MFLTFFGPQN